MTRQANRLPAGFEALEPFVERWALAGTAERAAARATSSTSEKMAFYRAGQGLAAAGLELLDKKSLARFDEAENQLMNLMLSLAHVSIAVEMQKDDEPKLARYAHNMRFTRTTAGV